MQSVTQLQKLKALTGENNESILLAYLEMAAAKINEKAFPFGSDCGDKVPKKYLPNQLEIAQYLYNKRGAEGEVSHNENGINRIYESASVPESMLKGITPFVGVMFTASEEG